MVANKTDLCSDEPPPLPNVEFGQAVHIESTPPPASSSTPDPSADDASTSKPASGSASTGTDKGTRTDLRPRAVTATEGAMFAKEHGLLYVETSAKEGWHVVDAFEWTAREVLASVSRTELDRRKVSPDLPCYLPSLLAWTTPGYVSHERPRRCLLVDSDLDMADLFSLGV